MLGIPDVAGAAVSGWAFEPPCHEPGYPDHPPKFPTQGNCTGDWTHNGKQQLRVCSTSSLRSACACTVTMYDYLRVPEHLQPGEYVLGFVSNPSPPPS